MATLCCNGVYYNVPDNCTVNITSNSVWDGWISNTGTSSATTTWNSWTNTITSTATANTVWISWVSSGTNMQQYGNQIGQQGVLATPEQVAERNRVFTENVERQRQQAAEAKAKLVAAQKRAMELLRENLSQKQREALDKNGWFLVEGGKSKKTYRIHGNQCAGNIFERDTNGKEIARYCVHASYEIPLGDQLLSQMISLRLDEDHIIGRANRTALAA